MLDLAAGRLPPPSGASVELTRAEMHRLELLSEHPGQPVHREAIARRMGKSPEAGDLRYVDAIVSRLRRKIVDTLRWDPPIRAAHTSGRSAERRVGKEGVSGCGSGWSRVH